MSDRKTLRLLFVEDDPADVELIVHELEESGYRVSVRRVQHAAEMRAALAAESWDVVLADYQLPAFSAPEALEVVQRTGLDLPFIIVSGTVGEETAVAALKAGAHDFLVKGRLARLAPAIERGLREVAQRGERARTELALRQSESRYRSLVDHAVFGMCEATLDGQFRTVNRALVTMLGYDSAAALQEVGLWGAFAEPGDGAAIMSRAVAENRMAGEEAIWQRRSGDRIRVRLSGKRIGEERDPVATFELIVEDITEQHRLQEQLRQSQKMEAIGRLAGGVAHDFNNMLTAILGYAELLTEQIGPDKPIGQDLLEIKKAAERAAALTRQLLAFSKKQVLTMAPVNVTHVVRTLEPMLRRLIGERVAIRSELDEAVAAVMADVVQLEHLLINLAVNGRDAMQQGGTLTLTTGNVTLDDHYVRTHPGSRPGDYAMIAVADTGTGMTKEVQARLFEPFFTTKEQGRGTGLGLAVVYGTVKQLGGYIEVDSRLGAGTTFRIYLPVTARKVELPAPLPAQDTPVGKETILLVEDEPAVRAFTKVALQRFGYQVIDFDSAESALASLEGHADPIHLLLTDVVLPGIDGSALAKRVVQKRPGTPVLFMSGYNLSLGGEHRLLERGVHLLEKPFTAEALLVRTRELLTANAPAPAAPATPATRVTPAVPGQAPAAVR